MTILRVGSSELQGPRPGVQGAGAITEAIYQAQMILRVYNGLQVDDFSRWTATAFGNLCVLDTETHNAAPNGAGVVIDPNFGGANSPAVPTRCWNITNGVVGARPANNDGANDHRH